MELSLGFCYRLWPVLGSWIISYLVRLSPISNSTYAVLYRMPLSPGKSSYPFFLHCVVAADMFLPILLIAKVKLIKL